MANLYQLMLVLALVFICSVVQAQNVPQAFNYQAIARNDKGEVLNDQNIGLRITIIEVDGSGTQNQVYIEERTLTTNQFGLIEVRVGTGDPTLGDFEEIGWGNGSSHFLQVEYDPEGGNNYTISGITQILSVPYALYAETSGGTADGDSDATNELQQLSYDPDSNILSLTQGQSVDLSDLEDEVSGGDDQNLTLNGTALSIDNGNTVDLSVIQDGVDDADADPMNEIQNLSLSGTSLSIEGANTIDLNIIQDGVDDADADPTNEFQDINYDPSTKTLSIENGGSVDLSDLEDDVTGGDDQTLSLSGTTLSIEGGNAVDLSILQDGVIDPDADPMNELQDLNFNTSNNFLSITDGLGVDLSTLAGGSGGSDDQTLNLNGTVLEIEDGNTVDLSVLQDGVDDADADPMNELQDLSFNTNTSFLSITDGVGVDLSALEGGTGGSDDQTLNLNGTVLEIEDGNTVDLGILQDGVDDADADPTNELQTISYDPTTNVLSLEDGGTVDLSELDDTATGGDDQTLNLNGTVLEIEDGNSVDLSVLQDGVDDADADPVNEIQDLDFNPGTNFLSITDGVGVDLSSLAGGTGGSDDQTLNLNGTVLEIEDGNTVDLSVLQDGVDDADADPTNEIQNLNLASTTLSIDNGNSVDLSVLQDGVDDADADPTNELQDLSYDPTTNILSLSNGLGVDLSELDDNVVGADDQTLNLNGTILEIEDGNTVDLSVLQDGVDDADADPTNEIQTIAYDPTTNVLSLEDGGTVDLSDLQDAGMDTDDQNLIFNSPQLSIDDGNTVDLSLLIDDADPDPINEIQVLTLNGTELSLTPNGGEAPIDLAGSFLWRRNGMDIYYDQGDVGIGLDLPLSPLHVADPDLLSGQGAVFGEFTGTDQTDGVGVVGRSVPVDFYGIGGQFIGGWKGVEGFVIPEGDAFYYGVFGDVFGGTGTNFGVYGSSGGGTDNYAVFGLSTSGTNNYGLYGRATGGTDNYAVFGEIRDMTEQGFAGYFTNEGLQGTGVFGETTGENSIAGNFEATGDNSIAGRFEVTGANSRAGDFLGNVRVNGRVAVGTNTTPDEELVVGNNLNSGWAIPAITVSDATGGAIELGNPDFSISMSSGNTFSRSRIIANSPDGFGLGEIEMRADGVSIGENTGGPGFYMTRIVHDGFGLSLEQSVTEDDWELYTEVDGFLDLFFNVDFRGNFDPITGAYMPVSDRRLKENIRPLDAILPKVNQLKPASFNFIHDDKKAEKVGFIAQEVAAVFPELVKIPSGNGGRSDFHTVDYASFSVVAIQAIQEQQAIIEQQQEEIDALKAKVNKIDELEALVKQLLADKK